MIELLITIILAAVIAQLIDAIIISFKKKRLAWNRLCATGGFPSSHSSGVAALATGIYLLEGMSTGFIIALAFAAVVLRDAIGVRLEVGRHSKFLNKKHKTKFNEKAGHTPKEVLGGIILGIIIAVLIL